MLLCSRYLFAIEKVGIRMMDNKKIMTYDYEFSRYCPSKWQTTRKCKAVFGQHINMH